MSTLIPAITTQVAQPSANAQRSQRELLASAWRSAWFIAIPMLMTLLMMCYLLPSSVESRGTLLFIIAQAALGNPLIFGVCLFLVFSSLTRYWRYHLPGFRLTLPLASGRGRPLLSSELRVVEDATTLLRRLTRPRAVLRRNNSLNSSTNAAVDSLIRELGNSLAHDNLERAAACMRDLRGYENPAIKEYQWADWLRIAAMVLTPILLALGFRAQILQSCKILGSSMLPTLQGGDSVGIKPSAYRGLLPFAATRAPNGTPRRGDIVVFDNPEATSDEYLVKRVIGIPGDQISMKNGPPTINGWSIPYCDAGVYANIVGDFEPVLGRVIVEFLEDRAYLTLYTITSTVTPYPYTYQVKDHEVFVLGDNRFGSSDSRSWNDGRGGGVPISTIRGRVDWFLVGTTRNGTSDFTKLFKQLGLQPRLEGIDASTFSNRINDCIKKKSAQTWPPPPTKT